MSPLLSLASRVESASGADMGLAREVLLACGWRKGCRGYFLGLLETWTSPDGKIHFDDDRLGDHDPTASLDAAMSLVPEGWRWMVGHREYPRARAYVENGELAFVGVGTAHNPKRKWFEVTAAAPALALTAASLRALAGGK